MLSAAANTSPTAYWYLTRGTGAVALILLTLSVGLGTANVRRLRIKGVPRFVLDAVHRNVSLLAAAFLLIHIGTSLLDGYAPIRIVDGVIPFVSAYRPLWVGLGALAFDLILAIVLTSLLRQRLGHRVWRLTHWVAYACWPVALLHALGTGSDAKARWMLVIVGGCVIGMIAAVMARIFSGWPDHRGARVAALAAAALVPLGVVAWLPSGPLAAGWAQKAGTPVSLLRATRSPASSSNSPSSGSAASAMTAFTTSATGTVRQGRASDDLGQVEISLSLQKQTLNTLAIQLRGEPLEGGGLKMTSSVVTLGPRSHPTQYRGVVTSLEGTNIVARVSDASGKRLALVARLQIQPDSRSASGTVSGAP